VGELCSSMEAQEKRDLEAGFRSALEQIESGDSNCTLIETSAGGLGINAVVLVRGDMATFEICQAVLAVMSEWDYKRALAEAEAQKPTA
jgi:hypothetical protein